jgi:phenylacetate-CoA ligase
MAAAPYDSLETRDPALREAALFEALRALVATARAKAPLYAERYAAVEPREISGRAALAALPVLRKSELTDLQTARPPLGGIETVPPGRFLRLFSSPGPITVPQPAGPDHWRMARAMHAAGFRKGSLVYNTFSYHFSPGAWIMEGGAHALGCPVFPGGTGQTDLQARTIAVLRPGHYAGTPSFLKLILEKAAEDGLDLSCLTSALVSGEAFPPSLQKEIADRGIDAYQCYASADLGLIAYESAAREGLIADEGALIEIVRPGTGDPVPEGEVGEVLVTTFNAEYPLIRFATGDLSAILPGASPCGRTNLRIKGWMGRADQSAKVRGLFVHPHQIAAVLKRHPEVLRGRVTIDQADGGDRMTLACEADSAGDNLESAIAESLRDLCKLRGEVRVVAPGSLPNDGKVIDDIRRYE